MTARPPRTSSRYRNLSALIARRAVREASRAAKASGPTSAAVLTTIASHQAAQAVLAQQSVADILAEQGAQSVADAVLNSLAFTTSVDRLEQMVAATVDEEFDRLVASLVQDAGRAAQSVAVVTHPKVGWVRHLTLPSCGRCAVLAGRVYRYSEGFLRHPNCDCTMIPVTVASPDFTYDLDGLVRDGQIHGLSQADAQAVLDGADLGRVVNIRRRAAGLTESGRVLSRGNRPTPEAIYRSTSTRDEALAALKAAGYIR